MKINAQKRKLLVTGVKKSKNVFDSKGIINRDMFVTKRNENH